jgi:sugar transferase (PEP-CTERM/EpsH1 system associated)
LHQKQPPLVAHIIYRLAIGGLENGLVNLINRTPMDRYRHAVVCLTEFTDFRARIRTGGVPVIALHKREGMDLSVHIGLWNTLRRLRPDIVHTRSLPAVECIATAALAGVRGRIHGEHGRDIYDMDGSNRKYNRLRKVIRPLIHHYVAVSNDLADWLVYNVGVSRSRVTQVYNGVDMQHFQPRTSARCPVGPPGFADSAAFVIGTVGRMEAVKDQLTLVHAFVHLLNSQPTAHKHLRLVIIGDGALRSQALRLLQEGNAAHLAWVPGERDDIAKIMRGLDLFVLPSLREGISNTILEAMATGLPVVATRVGGNPELINEGKNGVLVAPADPIRLADAIHSYIVDGEKLRRHGLASLRRVEAHFGIEAMVNGYLRIYDLVSKSTESTTGESSTIWPNYKTALQYRFKAKL